MPVRSLNSRVLKWPKADEVVKALRLWVQKTTQHRQEILRIGYFGSYARGDWGVGSDLDVVIILKNSDKPFIERSAEWYTTDLPVPMDVLVYTESEWMGRMESRGQFRDVIWVHPLA